MRITRRFEFEAAHRLLGYDGPCGRIHGHTYVLELTFEGQKLDDLGMLVDFGEINGIAGSWIEYHWDHHVIIHPDDRELSQLRGAYEMSEKRNPTAENMILEFVDNWNDDDLHVPGVKLSKIKLYETSNSWAELEL